jgi:hypothetical protein
MLLDLQNVQVNMNFFQNEAGRPNGNGPFESIRQTEKDNITMNAREITTWLNESRQTDLDVICHKCLATLESILQQEEAMTTENQKKETRCIYVYRKATSRTVPKQPEASLFVTEKVPID